MYFAMMFDRIEQEVNSMELCVDADDALEKCVVLAANIGIILTDWDEYHLKNDGVLKIDKKTTLYLGVIE